MDENTLRCLLDDLRAGKLSTDDALTDLKRLPFADLGFARIDHHRMLRQCLPEAIYAPGKSPAHCAAIVTELLEHGTGPVILSRANADQAGCAMATNPSGKLHNHELHNHEVHNHRTVVWRFQPQRGGRITVATAGTADLPVADECITTLVAQGFRPRLVADVGVAGIHRLLAVLDEFDDLDALVVIAGMEGALASIIGGITAAPVIAVPTSVGYGASLEGITALLAMLASCASGVTVVGIDNGFGAACAVARIMSGRYTGKDVTNI